MHKTEFHRPAETAMASIVAAVFKATIGLLVTKGRNLAADKLKDGDVTDEQFRSFIVREIDDIKSKLDGLARTNLLASICFFKEGLVYLYKVLDLKAIEEDIKFTEQGAEGKEKNSDPNLRPSQAASVKTVSLAKEMKSFQVTEQDDSTRRALSDAKDRFKKTREKATEAFCNEALSTSDRILAIQYRVMASVLEKVDNPAEALGACRLCLEELHSMPTVQKSFNVHLNQGVKSWFNKAEREEIIYSVCRMNRVIFQVSQVVGDINLSFWPCVVVSGEEKVDPLRDTRVTESLQEEEMKYCLLKPWSLKKKNTHGRYGRVTTNKEGQFCLLLGTINEDPFLKLFNHTGKRLQSYRLRLPENEKGGRVWYIDDIDIDRDNNVFLLVNWTSKQDDLKSHWGTVYIFDEHANLQHEFNLKEGSSGYLIRVSDNNKVFVAVRRSDAREVQVYDTNGRYLHSFGEGILKDALDMTVTNSMDRRVFVLEYRNHEVYVHLFSEQGDHLCQVKCGDPKLSCVASIASDHSSENVFVLLKGSDAGHIYPRILHVVNKDGKFVRSIHLHTEGLISDYKPLAATVTKEGLVVTLAVHRITEKRMLVVL